ncbi:MAG: mannose-6-phosphate isomerase, class I [Treponema sp.]|jgi:mannose-6-phosphate isomerase|nr:mannose-6-phosphate isomerase, class I [Treponema sp.]
MLFKLQNTVKHYEWGSTEWIPSVMGQDNPQKIPWAELWMGLHPEGPSKTVYQGEVLPLSQLINENPRALLGATIQEKYGALPFLFKLLAADKPLSIQAHPNINQAGEGWKREELGGIALNAPERNYKDANHKPEILCALGPFTGMCGFREPAEIGARLECFEGLAPEGLRNTLQNLRTALYDVNGNVETGLRAFLTALFGMDTSSKRLLCQYALSAGAALTEKYPQYREEWGLASSFAGIYSEDPAVIAPLYLNCINLEKGDAVYLPAGILHAYVKGFGVELMANSDNVLRGGLTKKHIDIDELLKVLLFKPFKPAILRPEPGNTPLYTYPTEAEEFSLSVLQGGTIMLEKGGPFIAVVIEGKAALSIPETGEELSLEKGESAFIGAERNTLGVSGDFCLYLAGIGNFS